MLAPALFLAVFALACNGCAAEPAVPLKTGPVSLRPLPAEKLHIQPPTVSFDLSAEALTKKLEADSSRFKAMNGRDLLDLSAKPALPTPPERFLNIFFPKGGSIFGKNPNAPPGGFTR
jgi:hypothetical protein